MKAYEYGHLGLENLALAERVALDLDASKHTDNSVAT
jgi:hypothetical protein